MTLGLRKADTADMQTLLDLTRAAFPGEDLAPLMRDLIGHKDVWTTIASEGGAPAAFICWTRCRVADAEVALLGPLAVRPDLQKQGIGSALIRETMQVRAAAGLVHALVLGDPAYYGRFGFVMETKVETPYPIPEDWRGGWQGRKLDGLVPEGVLQVPEPWQNAALWSP